MHRYTCLYNVKNFWHKQVKRNMSAKQKIHKWHRSESINMVAKIIVCMHITAELKSTGTPVKLVKCCILYTLCNGNKSCTGIVKRIWFGE